MSEPQPGALISRDWMPMWTSLVKVESGGRYPLGLNRFHNGLEELLIKSITWLASSLSTFSYSCWAIGDITDSQHPQTFDDFVVAFQRRETALAVGRYLWRPTDHIPGSTRVSARISIESADQETEYSVMESNVLGTFGLYYAGSAFNLGLMEYDTNGVPILTSRGRQLHDILDDRYRRTKPSYYLNYRGKSRVPSDVLIEWGQLNHPDLIRTEGCRSEREIYQNLLFRLDEPQTVDYRRDTLAFIMTCIDECAAADASFTQDTLRNIDYYAAYHNRAGDIVEFVGHRALQDVHFYWGIYEGHVFFRQWLTRLFQVFLVHLKGRSNGSTVDEFLDSLNANAFNQMISELLRQESEWYDLPMGELIAAIGRPPRLSDRFSEASIDSETAPRDVASIVAARFAVMMTGLWQHFRPLRSDERFIYVMGSLSDDLWFNTLLTIPRLQTLTVRAFLRTMLDQYVVQQHDKIMLEKRDLRRCWFTVENGRLFFTADANLLDRPAKYDTIIGYLTDMNLIQATSDSLEITDEGRALYTRLRQEYYS